MATLINPALCISCGICITECPHGAIADNFTVTQTKCDGCDKCVEVCPTGAFFDCTFCPTCEGICSDGPMFGIPKRG
jgi:ferredoxin